MQEHGEAQNPRLCCDSQNLRNCSDHGCDSETFEEGTYRLLKSGLTADFELGVEWTE